MCCVAAYRNDVKGEVEFVVFNWNFISWKQKGLAHWNYLFLYSQFVTILSFHFFWYMFLCFLLLPRHFTKNTCLVCIFVKMSSRNKDTRTYLMLVEDGRLMISIITQKVLISVLKQNEVTSMKCYCVFNSLVNHVIVILSLITLIH